MGTTYGTSKTYSSGKVSDKTKENFDKYSQEYKPSESVLKAQQQLQSLQKPGTFSSEYQQQMNDLYDQIINRPKFDFDVNESVMYEQLRDQYAALGKLAMKNTMGQAASMTGGYGSSYAQTAGQQSYQNFMQQLQEQIPSLYQMELQRYTQEGDDMMNQYGIAKDLYDTDYGRYRDDMSDYFTDRDYYTGMYKDERSFDYGQYQDNRGYWSDQYWNEKNSEQTTESTSRTVSSGNGSKTNDTKKAASSSSMAPLSNEYVKEITLALVQAKYPKAQEALLKNLYEQGKISESNLNYFYDSLGW